VIPTSVTTIGKHTFSFCKNLANITIPSSVTEIGKCAFIGDALLTSVTFAEGSNITSEDFGNNAFKPTDFKSGNALKEAYLVTTPHAGIYTREPGGKVWIKQDNA